ncbi:hypothetical protein MHZ95_13865 [Sporosarcina sp. ACRSM]|uniref:hypothetical protein n=1 Tax=Sporosarcina sp. ACRSM TaxID=2918216 RepID=UPI001EF3FFAE|nr:hypothetical protein [Sporosarcina sp. ACRSM]MCG7336350.1 hypothetical protein [Sporosarcina sp. ACRSM]
MVVNDSLMVLLLQMVVVFLILLIITFAVPKLQPLLYVAIFFFVLFQLLSMVVFPFTRTIIGLFEALPDPFAKLLIGSAILFFISELIAKHIEEAGFASLAAMSHFIVKIAILGLWLHQTAALIEILSSLITK